MISVMMPVYNAARFLKDSIESILNQTEQDFELIIVNDGSTDNSEEIILSYTDPRIVYLKKENGGESSARNMALNHARGEFIVFQDADDVSIATRLETLKQHFISKEIGFVHSDMMLIDENNKPIGYWGSQNIHPSQVIRFLLRTGTPYNNPSIMVRKNVIEPFQYNTAIKIGPDTDVVSQLALMTNSVHVNLPLLLYRRHSNNITNNLTEDELIKYIEVFLSRYTLEQLIPELNWKDEIAKSEIKAKAVIAYFLSRRGFTVEPQKWIDKAIQEAEALQDRDTMFFVLGIGNYATFQYKNAAEFLFAIEKKDCIVDNYIGEIYASIKDTEKATFYFLEALKKAPKYKEPIENLKALGALTNFNLIDGIWRKFK